MLDRLRRGAARNVMEADGGILDESVDDASADADMVFRGMATPDEEDDYVTYYTRLHERTAGLPPTVFVLAAEEISFRDVLA